MPHFPRSRCLICLSRNKSLVKSVESFMTQGYSGSARASSGGTRVGYTRVSTVAQTLEQQNSALAAAGVSKTFSDTLSGARDDRPGLAALLDYVREGDTVVVWKLDRLGRNTLHVLETVKALTDAGVTLISTTDGIDSSTAAGRMVIAVLASMAQFERELIRERTALKRSTSRANGTKFGRPRKVNEADHIATARRMKSDGHAATAERVRQKPQVRSAVGAASSWTGAIGQSNSVWSTQSHVCECFGVLR